MKNYKFGGNMSNLCSTSQDVFELVQSDLKQKNKK